MKFIFTFLIFSACLLMASRKKEATKKTSAPAMKRNTLTTINGQQTITYNPDGTPAFIVIPRAGYQYRKQFTYSPGKINYTLLLNDKKQEEGEYVSVNGRIRSFNWVVFDSFGDTSNRYAETFAYNEKGLLQKHTFNKAWSEYAYDNTGNLVEASHYNAQGQPTTKVAYAYTNNKDLFPAIGYFNSDGSGSGFFLPAFSNYLPASRKVTKVATGQITQRSTFSYEFDTDGYMVKGRSHSVVNDEPDMEWTNNFQ